MALSSRLKEECPTCKRVAVEKSRFKIGSSTVIYLTCGHQMYQGSLTSTNDVYESIMSSDGKRLRAYQIEGVKFLEASNANAILADEQGLGKTIQVASLLKLHPEELLPSIIVPPNSVKLQWLWELIRWCGKNQTFITQVISKGSEIAMPGMGIYIVTYDMLKKADEIFVMVPEIKSIFLD